MNCKDLGLQDSSQRIVLHLALNKKFYSVILPLIDNMTMGDDFLDLQDCNGVTALHLSARQAHPAILHQLLMCKVSTESQDCYGRTPLHVAALAGETQHAEVIQVLLAHGAKVNTADFDGWTALHFAVAGNNRTIARILIKAGTDVDAVTTQGWAPLHVLISIGDEKLSQDLLQAGANPNLSSERGATVLHEAIYAKKTATVHNLLSAGADPLLFDAFGRTAIDWALINNCILEVARQHCKDLKPTDPAVSSSILHETICQTAKVLLSESSPRCLNHLGHCLPLCNDDEEASTAFKKCMTNWGIEPVHPAVCDMCDDNECIKGVRFICRTCADTDLFSSCMSRYHSETLVGQAWLCQGHQFIKVLSNDRESLLNDHANRIGETSEQWLTRLVKNYTAEEHKEC